MHTISRIYTATKSIQPNFKFGWIFFYIATDIFGYSEKEMAYFKDIVESGAHLIIRFAELKWRLQKCLKSLSLEKSPTTVNITKKARATHYRPGFSIFYSTPNLFCFQVLS